MAVRRRRFIADSSPLASVVALYNLRRDSSAPPSREEVALIMRRILLLVTVALVMAAMMVATTVPAFAAKGGNGGGAVHSEEDNGTCTVEGTTQPCEGKAVQTPSGNLNATVHGHPSEGTE
jgi:hypothetical protein